MAKIPSQRARKQLLVEREVQFSLSRQLITHWLILVATTTFVAVGLRTVANFAEQSFETAFWEGLQLQLSTILVSLALVPFFVLDSLRLSNRFAGPMVRLRKNMKALADGEAVPPIVFRKKDYWVEVADQFNRVRQIVLSKRESHGVIEQTSGLAAIDSSTLNPNGTNVQNTNADEHGPESLNSESDSLWNNAVLSSATTPTPPSSPIVGSFNLPSNNDFGIRDVPPSMSHR